jgi:propionate CoA-transferase
MFNAGARMSVVDGRMQIDREGKTAKFVEEVNQVSFSGKRAKQQNQDVTYITERCVIRLIDGQLVVTEIAPGLDLKRDVLDQAAGTLAVSDDLKTMDAALFRPEPFGLRLGAADA